MESTSHVHHTQVPHKEELTQQEGDHHKSSSTRLPLRMLLLFGCIQNDLC